MFEGKDVKVFLARAGAGKSTTLINIVEDLIKTVPPEEIAFISFTRNAVREVISRLQRVKGIDSSDFIYFRTVHSLIAKLFNLKKESFLTHKDYVEFSNITSFDITNARTIFSKSRNYDVSGDCLLLEQIAQEKLTGRRSDDVKDIKRYNRLKSLWENYKDIKGKTDFNDYLIEYLKHGEPSDVKYVFLDEWQDSSYLQNLVVEKAFANAEKIWIAGDDWQSIYGFIGARPGVLVDLAKEHTTVELSKSYRIPKAVARFCKGITEAFTEGTIGTCDTYREDEGSVQRLASVNELVNLMKNSESTWYVLYRCRCFMTELENKLLAQQILYCKDNDFCVKKSELSLLKKYKNYQCINYGTEEARKAFKDLHGIKDFSLSWEESNLIPEDRKLIVKAYVDKYGLEYLQQESVLNRRILLSTIHGVKGSEADNVVLFLDTTAKVDRHFKSQINDELRLLYVACTRAKQNLYLMKATKDSCLENALDVIIQNYGGLDV